MNKLITDYKSIIFDCDGVILKSNEVKTNAFYTAVQNYGHAPAQALVDYHIANGGISRYSKFEYFIKNILKKDVSQNLLDDLSSRFSSAVTQGLMSCDIAEGLHELREKTSHANWLVVSGGDQEELRNIFRLRELASLFNGGIFGSPDNKDIILSREISTNNICANAVFLGDSKYDFEASKRAGIDFCFMSDWTEVVDWESWAAENDITTRHNILGLTEV